LCQREFYGSYKDICEQCDEIINHLEDQTYTEGFYEKVELVVTYDAFDHNDCTECESGYYSDHECDEILNEISKRHKFISLVPRFIKDSDIRNDNTLNLNHIFLTKYLNNKNYFNRNRLAGDVNQIIEAKIRKRVLKIKLE